MVHSMMKSITLHNLDDQLALKIEEIARNEGTSLNKTIQKLLRQSLGLSKAPQQTNKEAFMDLFGVWNDEDYQEFHGNIGDLEKFNPDDWK